jgi:hypothetical protein
MENICDFDMLYLLLLTDMSICTHHSYWRKSSLKYKILGPGVEFCPADCISGRQEIISQLEVLELIICMVFFGIVYWLIFVAWNFHCFFKS